MFSTSNCNEIFVTRIIIVLLSMTVLQKVQRGKANLVYVILIMSSNISSLNPHSCTSLTQKYFRDNNIYRHWPYQYM
jgi:hypothetical protein